MTPQENKRQIQIFGYSTGKVKVSTTSQWHKKGKRTKLEGRKWDYYIFKRHNSQMRCVDLV